MTTTQVTSHSNNMNEPITGDNSVDLKERVKKGEEREIRTRLIFSLLESGNDIEATTKIAARLAEYIGDSFTETGVMREKLVHALLRRWPNGVNVTQAADKLLAYIENAEA